MLKTFTSISSGLPGCVGEVRQSGNFTLCVTRSNFSVVAHASARPMLHEVVAMLPLCRTPHLGRRIDSRENALHPSRRTTRYNCPPSSFSGVGSRGVILVSVMTLVTFAPIPPEVVSPSSVDRSPTGVVAISFSLIIPLIVVVEIVSISLSLSLSLLRRLLPTIFIQLSNFSISISLLFNTN